MIENVETSRFNTPPNRRLLPPCLFDCVNLSCGLFLEGIRRVGLLAVRSVLIFVVIFVAMNVLEEERSGRDWSFEGFYADGRFEEVPGVLLLAGPQLEE